MFKKLILFLLASGMSAAVAMPTDLRSCFGIQKAMNRAMCEDRGRKIVKDNIKIRMMSAQKRIKAKNRKSYKKKLVADIRSEIAFLKQMKSQVDKDINMYKAQLDRVKKPKAPTFIKR